MYLVVCIPFADATLVFFLIIVGPKVTARPDDYKVVP